MDFIKQPYSALDQIALDEFLALLPPGARVLDLGCGGGRDLIYFTQKGFDAEGVYTSGDPAIPGLKVRKADLRMLSLARESYDGIWVNLVLSQFNSNECQRVLLSCFNGLKSKGALFVSIVEGSVSAVRVEGITPYYEYRADDFASLIRQSGFSLLKNGKSEKDTRQIAFIAKRV